MTEFLDFSKGMFNQPGFLDLSANGINFVQPQNTWTPKKLFTAGEAGAWYDPSDISTLFMDAAGTVPVTADGDPVGMMKDKSGNGNHATQTLSASRPTYHANGVRRWITGDGIDDYLIMPGGLFDVTKSASIIFSITQAARKADPYFMGTTPADKGILFLTQSTFGTPRPAVMTTSGILVFTAVEAMVLNTPYVFSQDWDRIGGSLSLLKNRVSIGSATGTPTNISAVTHYEMFRNAAAARCWSGNFYGGVFISSLIDAQKSEVYLAKKAGVTL